VSCAVGAGGSPPFPKDGQFWPESFPEKTPAAVMSRVSCLLKALGGATIITLEKW